MINFLSKADAEAAFGDAQAEYAAKFCTKPATIGYFNEVREWSKGSPTARAIIKRVEEADVVINFIGMNGGFQCFDESAKNRLSKRDEPTIYIDLLGKISVYVRKPHENVLSRSQTPHANMSSFNNRIALLHELGHAKQFIERPEWYRFYAGAKKEADSRAKLEPGREKAPATHGIFRQELETKATEVWTRKLTPKPKIASGPGASAGSPGGMPPKPPAALGPPGPPAASRASRSSRASRTSRSPWRVECEATGPGHPAGTIRKGQGPDVVRRHRCRQYAASRVADLYRDGAANPDALLGPLRVAGSRRSRGLFALSPGARTMNHESDNAPAASSWTGSRLRSAARRLAVACAALPGLASLPAPRSR